MWFNKSPAAAPMPEPQPIRLADLEPVEAFVVSNVSKASPGAYRGFTVEMKLVTTDIERALNKMRLLDTERPRLTITHVFRDAQGRLYWKNQVTSIPEAS